MSSPKFDYEDIVFIDKRIQVINQEVTHINKTLKHYGHWMECLDQGEDQTFLEYENALKNSYIEERSALINRRKEMRSALINRRKEIISKYQEGI